jgi:hypothetical protein
MLNFGDTLFYKAFNPKVIKRRKVNHPIGKLEKHREITFRSYFSQEVTLALL